MLTVGNLTAHPREIRTKMGSNANNSRSSNLRIAVYRALAEAGGTLTPTEIAAKVRLRPGRRTVQEPEAARVRALLIRDAQRETGLFVRTRWGRYDLRSRASLRLRILGELGNQGFLHKSKGGVGKLQLGSKDALRAFHARARADKYESLRSLVEEKEAEILPSFAEGQEVDVESFFPTLEIVKPKTPPSDLFRYATLLWSVPVSEGFGRRVRFLVRDRSNGKLVGLFALGDPVFNLRCRDRWIGWNVAEREARLYNVMDVFVLGAVPPYSYLLGGKLIALLAASNEVRRLVERRYRGSRTTIRREIKSPRLALLTTGSALGKSSLYDRIKFAERLVYQRIGVSEGWGHFHLNNGLFEEMRAFLAEVRPNLLSSNRFGHGPNWKMRTARVCLEELGLQGGLLRHGIQREIYGIPLATNFREYLQGEEHRLKEIDIPFDNVAAYFKNRWMMGRADRRPEYRHFKRDQIQRAIRLAGGPEPGGVTSSD